MGGRGPVGDPGRRGLGHILLAAVPQVAVELVETAVSGEWAVQPRQAAMETALLRASVNRSVGPGRRGGAFVRATDGGRKAGGRGLAAVPVLTSAAQAAMATGLAVDTAGLAPRGGGVALVGLHGIIWAIHDSQVGRRRVCGGALKGKRRVTETSSIQDHPTTPVPLKRGGLLAD